MAQDVRDLLSDLVMDKGNRETLAKMRDAFATRDSEQAQAELAFHAHSMEKAIEDADMVRMLDMAVGTSEIALDLLEQLMYWIPATNIAMTAARTGVIMSTSDTRETAVRTARKDLGTMKRSGSDQLARCATLRKSVRKQMEDLMRLMGVAE